MAAEATVSSVVQILGDLLIQKLHFLQGVEGEVRWLRDELKRMQSFLKDAAQKQANDERIHNWISDIREVAQDAEDAIDIFVLKVEEATRRRRGLLGSFVSFPNRLYHLNRVGKEIKSIRKRLEDIKSSRETYGIRDLGENVASNSGSREVERRRRLAPWQNDKDVVGLEEDLKSLLKGVILDDRELGLSIATIEGMGGIGKSTLARKIYNHAAVAYRFECRAWVVVSSDFTPEETVKQVIVQLPNSEEERRSVLREMKEWESMNDKLFVQDKLKEMLHKQLEGKQYFIVLDDVWEQRHWESLESAFPSEDKGSRLLLTSRNQIMTKYTQCVHSMKFLDSNESWKLFLKKASLDNTDDKFSEDLEYIGKKILEKCNGLPLAISVMGGLLAKQTQSKSEWQKVLKGINSHLGRSGSNVSAILQLSYNNLPPQLKPCFLCLAFFKEDATIQVEKLVNIWIAYGLVSHEEVGGREIMEDVARDYLDELIKQNLVQVKDMTMDDRVKTCHVHDLIRELSITKANEEIKFEIIREGGNSLSSRKPRHCTMYYSEEWFVDSTNQNKYLRSLFIHGSAYQYIDDLSSYWKSFELLRVLDLEGCRLRKLPDAIGALIGLRYLGLRNTTIDRLPRWLGKLKNLEVIDLRKTYIEKIPKFVTWKMDNLSHLYMSMGLWWELPLKISTLKNIRTLSCVWLRDSDLEQVTKMTSLCEFGLDVEGILDVSKLFTSLATLENLVRLKLVGPHFENMDGLGALNRITHLKLVGLICRIPTVTNFPPNLSYLTLERNCLDKDQTQVLEKLPKLLSLKLVCAKVGTEMVVSDYGFPKLERLYVRRSLSLFIIRVGKGAMPALKRLEIPNYLDRIIENMPERLRSIVTYTIDD